MDNEKPDKTKVTGSLHSPTRAIPAKPEGKTGNEELDKIKAGFKLNTLLPIALAELLQSKGIITKDELNKAMTNVVLEIAEKGKGR